MQVNSETDFVARNDQFVDMVGQVAAAALKAAPPNREGDHFNRNERLAYCLIALEAIARQQGPCCTHGAD